MAENKFKFITVFFWYCWKYTAKALEMIMRLTDATMTLKEIVSKK